jgi:LCP family protein required for cell wall assembly
MTDFQVSPSWETPPQPDPLAETQPTMPRDGLSDYQPVRIPGEPHAWFSDMKPRTMPGCGCSSGLVFLLAGIILAAYLFLPVRTNVLILGIDDRAAGSAVGRSDTMILATFQPIKRYIVMLSIPRDLWVQIPGHGENRINTAHFFAEAQQPGSGPQAAKEVVQANFGVDVDYSVRVRFDNFKEVIDTLGGIQITLLEPMSGYPAGTHLLNSDQALAFVRDRAGSDDFSRMNRGQIFLHSLVTSALSPANIPHWPVMARVGLSAVETDIPIFLWPKFGTTLFFVGLDRIDARLITREMVYPFMTSEGAQVLEPRWDIINLVLLEMFGQ